MRWHNEDEKRDFWLAILKERMICPEETVRSFCARKSISMQAYFKGRKLYGAAGGSTPKAQAEPRSGFIPIAVKLGPGRPPAPPKKPPSAAESKAAPKMTLCLPAFELSFENMSWAQVAPVIADLTRGQR